MIKGTCSSRGRLRAGHIPSRSCRKAAVRYATWRCRVRLIDYAGATLWDGKYLGFTDQDAGHKNTTVIFRASVSNFKVKIVGRIHLTDDCLHGYTDVMQPFVVPVPGGSPSTVVGGNLSCEKRFDFWSFPSGSHPKATLPDAPVEPVGQSVTRGS